MLQLSVNKQQSAAGGAKTLADLEEGDCGVISGIDIERELARRLMELGFIPGHPITVGRSAPGGDPRIYRVDGSEIALRHDTAARILLRSGSEAAAA